MPRAVPLALLVALCSCSAGGGPAVGERAQAVVGGSDDTAHPGVVAVTYTTSMDVCSGVLISPRFVLTAGHCVAASSPDELSIRFGADATKPDATRSVDAITLYPGTSGSMDDEVGGVDLAALHLEGDAPVVPIAIRAAPLGDALVGEDVTVVGYGNADGATSSGAGVRRSVTVPVTKLCARLIELGDDAKNACSGDSGGAVLAGEELVALVSFGPQGCFATSHHTRLDVHAAWIGNVLAGTPDAPCPDCLAPDPACEAPAPAASSSAPVVAPPSAGGPSAVEPTGSGCSMARERSDRRPFALLLFALSAIAARVRATRRKSSETFVRHP